jgi:hypothetical protein
LIKCKGTTCTVPKYMETPLEACSLSVATVFALKSGHYMYLDGEKATLVFAADGIRIVAYIKARGV